MQAIPPPRDLARYDRILENAGRAEARSAAARLVFDGVQRLSRAGNLPPDEAILYATRAAEAIAVADILAEGDSRRLYKPFEECIPAGNMIRADNRYARVRRS